MLLHSLLHYPENFLHAIGYYAIQEWSHIRRDKYHRKLCYCLPGPSLLAASDSKSTWNNRQGLPSWRFSMVSWIYICTSTMTIAFITLSGSLFHSLSPPPSDCLRLYLKYLSPRTMCLRVWINLQFPLWVLTLENVLLLGLPAPAAASALMVIKKLFSPIDRQTVTYTIGQSWSRGDPGATVPGCHFSYFSRADCSEQLVDVWCLQGTPASGIKCSSADFFFGFSSLIRSEIYQSQCCRKGHYMASVNSFARSLL